MNEHGPSILQCPSCGASLRVEKYETSITCLYCGNRVLVPEEYRPQGLSRPEPVRIELEVSAEELGPEIRTIETSPQVNAKGTFLIVGLAVALLGCLGGVILLLASGADNSGSRLSDQSSTQAPSSPGQVQGPSASAMPTFTPLAELLLKFGEEGEAEGQFDDPRYVAVDPGGSIFIADYSGGRVQKFDPQGSYLLQIDVPPSDPQSDIYIRGIGIDSQGRLYVARDGDILIFNSADGSHLDTIPNGWPDIYYDSLHIAGDLIYTTNGMAGTDDLLKLNPQGEILWHRQEIIESIDDDDPALGMQIAVDPQGQIYVLSSFGPHIYVYDSQGEYLYRFGEEGNGRGMIDLSSDLLAFDPRGRLYVVSGYRIDQFDSQGNYLDYSLDVYDDSDNGVPMGMTFDAQGYLYIICNNGRLLKYQINSR